MTPPLQEQLRELVDDWVFSLAEQYDKALPKVKQTLEDNPASDEDWSALLDPILALIAEAERAAKISETQYWFDLALTEDADAVLMNSLRRQFRNRLAQLQGEEQ